MRYYQEILLYYSGYSDIIKENKIKCNQNNFIHELAVKKFNKNNYSFKSFRQDEFKLTKSSHFWHDFNNGNRQKNKKIKISIDVPTHRAPSTEERERERQKETERRKFWGKQKKNYTNFQAGVEKEWIFFFSNKGIISE